MSMWREIGRSIEMPMRCYTQPWPPVIAVWKIDFFFCRLADERNWKEIELIWPWAMWNGNQKSFETLFPTLKPIHGETRGGWWWSHGKWSVIVREVQTSCRKSSVDAVKVVAHALIKQSTRRLWRRFHVKDMSWVTHIALHDALKIHRPTAICQSSLYVLSANRIACKWNEYSLIAI